MIYAITLILLALSTPAQLETSSPAAAAGAAPHYGGWLDCDAAFASPFVPLRPVWGRYEVCTSDEPVTPHADDGFTYAHLERLEALDAFGAAGAYDRARLAQLYAGRRVAVLRGWKRTADGLESVTRLSPYPDSTLAVLRQGTMVIRWRSGSSLGATSSLPHADRNISLHDVDREHRLAAADGCLTEPRSELIFHRQRNI